MHNTFTNIILHKKFMKLIEEKIYIYKIISFLKQR